jgi:hypothetical protein
LEAGQRCVEDCAEAYCGEGAHDPPRRRPRRPPAWYPDPDAVYEA